MQPTLVIYVCHVLLMQNVLASSYLRSVLMFIFRVPCKGFFVWVQVKFVSVWLMWVPFPQHFSRRILCKTGEIVNMADKGFTKLRARHLLIADWAQKLQATKFVPNQLQKIGFYWVLELVRRRNVPRGSPARLTNFCKSLSSSHPDYLPLLTIPYQRMSREDPLLRL